MLRTRVHSIAVAVLWIGTAAGCTDAPRKGPHKPAPTPGATGEARFRPDPSAPSPAAVHATATARAGLRPARRSLETVVRVPLDGGVATAAAHTDAPADSGFLGRPEHALLEDLRTNEIRKVTKGTGGHTLAFKLELASGTTAYFKPEQRPPHGNWFAEVAAFQLDRALGLGRVPPAASRRVPWSQLESAAAGDARSAHVVIARDGTVRGAMVAWRSANPSLPEKLVPAVTPPGWENWIRSEPFPQLGVTPYQQASAYIKALRRKPAQSYYQDTPEPNRAELPAELSDLIVFDFLTLNIDRFGADNANILTLDPSGPLVYLDNDAGFSRGPARRAVLDSRLAPVSKFRRKTIEALRALDLLQLKTKLDQDPLGPLLDAGALRGLSTRRDAVLAHVEAQRLKFGDSVYAW